MLAEVPRAAPSLENPLILCRLTQTGAQRLAACHRRLLRRIHLSYEHTRCAQSSADTDRTSHITPKPISKIVDFAVDAVYPTNGDSGSKLNPTICRSFHLFSESLVQKGKCQSLKQLQIRAQIPVQKHN